MPSRRQVLTGAGIALVGGTGAAAAVSRVRRSPVRARTQNSTSSSSSSSSSPLPSTVASSPLDWPMSQYDPAGTGYNPDASGPTEDVRVAWEHDAPDWFRGASAPIRLGETLYAVGHGLLALEVDGGERRFAQPGPYTSSPAATTASSYRTPTLAVTATGGVHGLNAGGGFEVPGLERGFGSHRWSGPGSGQYSPTIEHHPTANPVAVDGTVYAPVPGTDRIVALDADSGAVAWEVAVRNPDFASASFSRPSIGDGTLFVANWPSQVSAYDRDGGTELWQRKTEFDDDIDRKRLCSIPTADGVVVASRDRATLLEADTGEPIWERDLEGNAIEGTAAVAEGTIFLSDGRERFHALDLETGESLWSVPFASETTPVVADGTVYAVERNAVLVALDADTGTERFRYEPPEVPLSPPIVGDGRLYAVARGRAIALEEAR